MKSFTLKELEPFFPDGDQRRRALRHLNGFKLLIRQGCRFRIREWAIIASLEGAAFTGTTVTEDWPDGLLNEVIDRILPYIE